jgi:hypothetical protein
MSRTFSTKNGSVESLKLLVRCGWTLEEGEVALHGSLADAALLRRRAHRSVGDALGRRALQDGAQEAGDALVVVSAGPAGARDVVEAGQAVGAPAAAPVRDGGDADARALSDNGVGQRAGAGVGRELSPLGDREGEFEGAGATGTLRGLRGSMPGAHAILMPAIRGTRHQRGSGE